jgi:hypothetical protein
MMMAVEHCLMRVESNIKTVRVRRWWTAFAVALLFLLPLDLLTTLLSVSHHGLAVEANPLMLWLLGRGLPDLVLAHLAVTVLAVSGFELVIRIVEGISSTTQTRVALGVEIWLGLLIVSGVLLVLNNLLTIV